ncbi:MAG TPA: tetratricopeptide repeat protein, partial [Thermoanaerobaculia bacterium]|nr:tetratricopeptide repeat protein [Thermoanaerobaculia bacterium]
EIFETLREAGTVAIVWHQIGMVHQHAGDHDAAEDAYRRSLRIKVERGDRWGEAMTLNQLGTLAGRSDRPEEAVRLYRQSAEVFLGLGDRANEGRARSNAALRLLDIERRDEARRELQRSIECGAPHDHAAKPWKTFNLLRRLEQADGNEKEAAAARDDAVQAYLAFRRDGGENHSPGGKLAAAVHGALSQGEPEAVEKLADELAHLRESPDLPDWAPPLIPALQALLAGSRDPALAADPALDYDDAADLLLLLERLE